MNAKTIDNMSAKKLIKNGNLINDPWRYCDPMEFDHEVHNNRVILTFEHWQKEREGFMLNNSSIGIKVPGDIHPLDSDLMQHLKKIDLIAIEFTNFTDGRGFSLAAQLRQMGYRGELRATGSILLDQLNFLKRCGFDAFELESDDYIEQALRALDAYSENYQPGW